MIQLAVQMQQYSAMPCKSRLAEEVTPFAVSGTGKYLQVFTKQAVLLSQAFDPVCQGSQSICQPALVIIAAAFRR